MTATLTTGPYANTPRDVTFSLTHGRMDLATAERWLRPNLD